MSDSISGSIIEPEAAKSTTIFRPLSIGVEETGERDSGAGVPEVRWAWLLQKEPPRSARPAPVTVVPMQTVPDCVHAFVHAVAEISGVRCVVVEDLPGNVVHMTTFVEHLTEETRQKIYSIEGETIRRNPNLTFDFHVRRAEEVSGTPASISGKHYYAIWGNI